MVIPIQAAKSTEILSKYWSSCFIITLSILLGLTLCSEYRIFSIAFFALISFLFLISNFKLNVYFLIFSLFICYNFFPSSGIILADFVIILLILSYFIKIAFSGEFSIKKTPLDRSIILFLVVIGISLVNAVDLFAGIRYYGRHIQLFLLFYVLASGLKKEDIIKLLKFFLFLGVLNSVYCIYLFVLSRGRERIFGPAGVYFDNILVSLLLVSYVFYLFQQSQKGKVKYGVALFILLAALIATQARSAIIDFILGYLVVTLLALIKAKRFRLNRLKGNFILLTSLMIVFSTLLILCFPSIISGFSHRFLTVFNIEVGTIRLRFVLWTVALKAFLHSPLLGIGLGQFPEIPALLPEVRFIPLYRYVGGLTAHNITLSYLAETGLIGTICLYYFIFSFFKLSWLRYKSVINKEDLFLSLCLIGPLIFGEWTFLSINGMRFMFFLALMVVFTPEKLIDSKGFRANMKV